MLDQQISQNLASRGVGLADMLIRQLSNVPAKLATQGDEGADPSASTMQAMPKITTPANGKTTGSHAPHVVEFQNRLRDHAEAASKATGIPAKFMLGQAALETGWGKREIVAADGTSSHNLFGIKATDGWKGKTVQRPTTEYVNGVAHTKVEKFRVYDSYADGFKDYANMLRKNPRYENVLANAQDAVGFAQGLQRAGYATDPKYAAKLTRIINQTLSA
jgi:flagellar protein FlgJ